MCIYTLIPACLQIRGSIVVSISACHAEDPGSIPGRGVSPSAHYAYGQARSEGSQFTSVPEPRERFELQKNMNSTKRKAPSVTDWAKFAPTRQAGAPTPFPLPRPEKTRSVRIPN